MRRFGIWQTPLDICFGEMCHVSMANGSALPKVTCYAALYGNGGDSHYQSLARWKWCNGKDCTEADHARPHAAAGGALHVDWPPRGAGDATTWTSISDTADQWKRLAGDHSLAVPTFNHRAWSDGRGAGAGIIVPFVCGQVVPFVGGKGGKVGEVNYCN